MSKILTTIRYTDKPDSQVLDPFSCLIRLCLLNYKPLGTKLSFTNNKIVFQEPDFFVLVFSTIYSMIGRKYLLMSKEDIFNYHFEYGMEQKNEEEPLLQSH